MGVTISHNETDSYYAQLRIIIVMSSYLWPMSNLSIGYCPQYQCQAWVHMMIIYQLV